MSVCVCELTGLSTGNGLNSRASSSSFETVGPSGVFGEAVKTGCECGSSVGLNRGASARALLPARGLDVGVTAADRRARRREAEFPLSSSTVSSSFRGLLEVPLAASSARSTTAALGGSSSDT